MSCWKLAVLSSLLLSPWGLLQATAWPSPQPTIAQSQPPDPPSTPLPPNRTTPGGGLNPERASCHAFSQDLRALIPADNPVFTASAHPTILFFSPFESEQVQYGEFTILLWPDEQERHYQTRFTLPDTPGIVSLTLPSLSDYALAEDQVYRWYIQLYCADNTSGQPDLTLVGSIQRVATTFELAQTAQTTSPEIWYDTLAVVAEQLQTSPQDAQTQKDWHRLLQSIDALELATMEFSGPVTTWEEAP